MELTYHMISIPEILYLVISRMDIFDYIIKRFMEDIPKSIYQSSFNDGLNICFLNGGDGLTIYLEVLNRDKYYIHNDFENFMISQEL